jgi:hypothetical protein
MGSIVLDPGVKEMLLGDARDFLASEKVCVFGLGSISYWGFFFFFWRGFEGRRASLKPSDERRAAGCACVF